MCAHLSRREFLGLGLCAVPAAAGIDGRFVEPTWLRVTQLDLHPEPSCRFVQFSDLPYQGDADYAAYVVRQINALEPEFVYGALILPRESVATSAAATSR